MIASMIFALWLHAYFENQIDDREPVLGSLLLWRFLEVEVSWIFNTVGSRIGLRTILQVLPDLPGF
jgi:hypothetical protein